MRICLPPTLFRMPDGGGAVHVARLPVAGRARVANYVAAIGTHIWNGMMLEVIEANGQPALLMSRDGVVNGLATIDASDEGIFQILWMMRPSKLAAIS